MSSKAIFLALCASVLLSTGTTHAALFDRGNGLIYDDVLNVTWLQDANYAKTSGYDADGLMTWYEANTWASSLVYRGYSDWRLPKVSPINGTQFDYSSASPNGVHDTGLRITSPNAELSYMYYVNLGNDAPWDGNWNLTSCAYTNSCSSNSGLFNNIHQGFYWYGQQFELRDGAYWGFYFQVGFQTAESYSHTLTSAWAVRDGDVASSSVPEPTTIALTLLALAGLGFGRLRLRQL